MCLPYNKKDPQDIEKYAKKLIGKTFKDVLCSYFNDKEILNEKINYYNKANVKGGLGNLLEEYYFFYKPNSESKPDFEEANTELKVTPYEIKSNNELKAGERLVIGMIPNNEPIEIDFHKSHVLSKLALMLLILYLRDKTITKVDSKINYVSLFSILSKACKDDLKIIEEDYNIISNKIIQGKAHELSESDTKYLGACTKGPTAKKSQQKQYYGDVLAKRRAYSLKQSYMTYVINNYILKNTNTYDNIFSSEELDAKNFDNKIINIINNYIGKSEKDLCSYFSINQKTKNFNNLIVYRMLGVKTENASEFAKANIVIKTIRLKKNGFPKESMSFPSFKILDFIKEEFEDSEIYNFFQETRFLLVVFKEDNMGEYKLSGAKFWNMPLNELEKIGKKEWESYKMKFITGVKFTPKKIDDKITIVLNDLPKKRDTKIFHIRPHASKSAYIIDGIKYGNGSLTDMDELPNGNKMTKQCFWLNNSYIAEIIKDI